MRSHINRRTVPVMEREDSDTGSHIWTPDDPKATHYYHWDRPNDISAVVDFEIAFVDGRFGVQKLTVTAIEGATVTADLLRNLAIQRLVFEAVAGGARLVLVNQNAKAAIESFDAKSGPTDEALYAVAAVYRRALMVGEPPTKAVVDGLGLARSTAGRWVMKAREKGFLGKTTKGKAGV